MTQLHNLNELRKLPIRIYNLCKHKHRIFVKNNKNVFFYLDVYTEANTVYNLKIEIFRIHIENPKYVISNWNPDDNSPW